MTDANNVLIGIVTVDDMLDVSEAEATEDIQKIGGTEALDEPYTTIALSRMVKKRASWLTVLFLGEMLTATAMSYFEGEIAKAVVLAQFVPLVISSGGNAGSQAASLVIRALALGEFKLGDWWRVMRRELAAGTLLGALLGVIGFLRIAIWSQFSLISWTALDARRCYGRSVAGRRGVMGICHWFDDAPWAKATGFRPRDLECAIRGDLGGRHRPDHLLLGRLHSLTRTLL